MLKLMAEKAGLKQHYSSLEYNIEKAANTEYPLRSYPLLFFSYCFIGWIWEFALFLVLQNKVLNNGFFHGPWLPIYGIGGMMAIILFKNIRNNPLKVFFSMMIAAGILEYTTHALTELVYGVTWWDYSDYMFNINDRVCLEALAVFGILGCFSIYFIAPRLNRLIMKISAQKQDVIIYVLAVLFILDVLVSLSSPNMENIY